MWFSLAATVVLGFVLYKFLFSNKNKNYWKSYNIPEVDISKCVTNIDLLLGRKSLFHADDYVYEQLGPDGKFCGVIEQGNPVIIIKDMDILKNVLIKHFDHFVDRRQFFNEDDGSLYKMLFNLQGDEWKGIRNSVSPTFTTGKIRRMMEYFNGVGKDWVDELKKQAKLSKNGSVKIDAMNTVNQYTVDVIASTVFGLNVGVVKNPDAKFGKMANILSEFSTWQTIKFAFRLQFPKLSRLLGVKLVKTKPLNFFEQILSHGLQQRLNGEVKRNDFLQLLVEAKKGELKAVGSDELSEFEKEAQISTSNKADSKKQYLTDEIMNAQSVVFFFAGFSTTSNFIAFAIYALALHQDIQDRLRKEVGTIVKDDGSFDYDELSQLVYLDMVVCEVLRKFSATARLERVCVREYRDPDTDLTIPKGTIVVMPLNAIHHDKRYFDNPESFDPEHFTPEKKTARNPYAYMPWNLRRISNIQQEYLCVLF